MSDELPNSRDAEIALWKRREAHARTQRENGSIPTWESIADDAAQKVAELTEAGSVIALSDGDCDELIESIDGYPVAKQRVQVRRAIAAWSIGLLEQLETTTQRIEKYENDEASCCPEDFGFVEYIKVLSGIVSDLCQHLREMEQKALEANLYALSAKEVFVIRAGLAHEVPEGCWSTGPMNGDASDNVCPGCAALKALDTRTNHSEDALDMVTSDAPTQPFAARETLAREIRRGDNNAIERNVRSENA